MKRNKFYRLSRTLILSLLAVTLFALPTLADEKKKAPTEETVKEDTNAVVETAAPDESNLTAF